MNLKISARSPLSKKVEEVNKVEKEKNKLISQQGNKLTSKQGSRRLFEDPRVLILY